MSNYFFKGSSESFSHDEYVYGPNTSTGSFIFTGSKDTWNPTTGTIATGLLKIFDAFVLSPRSHGNFSDTFFSPPEKYFYDGLGRTSPPILTTLASSSFRLSINQDRHSRIYYRYLDEVATDASESTSVYTELT